MPGLGLVTDVGNAMPSIDAMTDEALLTVCRRLPWERRLENAGCGLSFPMGILASVGTFLLFGGQAWVGALITFVGVGILLNVGIEYGVNFRSGRHQAELRRRYKLQELPQTSADAEHFFWGDDPPDTVLLLQGRGLPHGNQHFIGVRLWQVQIMRATLQVQTMSQIDFRREVPFTAEKGEVELSAEECASLAMLLPKVEKADATEIGSTVKMAFPARSSCCGASRSQWILSSAIWRVFQRHSPNTLLR